MKPGIDPRVDYAFKKVFGSASSTPILLDFLNAVLKPPPERRIVEPHIVNPFNEKDAADDKRTVLDLKVRDQAGRQYNVEMEMRGTPTYPSRVLYYWAALHRDQLQEGDDYADLRPTISISIVNDVLFRDVPEHHLDFHLCASRQSGLIFSDQLTIHVLELPKFTRPVEELADPLDVWCYFLTHAVQLDTDQLPRSLDTPPVRQAMEVLDMLSKNEVERERYNARVKGERDYRSGLREAKHEGREEGREEGQLIGRIHLCQRMLKMAQSPADELCGLPLQELNAKAKALEQQLGLM